MLTPETIKIIIANGEGYNAEFKVRVPPKVRELTEEVCAFANSASDYVLIGVDDSNTIQGAAIDNSKRSAIQNSIHEISPPVSVKIYAVEVDGKTVWVIDVPSGENKLYIFSGAIYVREGANTQKLTTAEEIRSVFQQSGRIFFDDMLYHNFDMETNIDAGNYQDFLRESHINTTLPMEQILSNLRVLDDNNAMKHGGILFFAKNPEDYFFQAVVRCVLFKGTEKIYIIDDKTFCGPLYRQYQQAMM
jgi:ATP-dependent DNA helicase RecG